MSKYGSVSVLGATIVPSITLVPTPPLRERQKGGRREQKSPIIRK